MRLAWRSFLAAIRPPGVPSDLAVDRTLGGRHGVRLDLLRAQDRVERTSGRRYDSEKGAERCRMW